MERQTPKALPNSALSGLADGTCRTLGDLEQSVGLTRKQIANGLSQLIRGGYAERVETGCYRLTETGIALAEKGGTLPVVRGANKKARRLKASTFVQRAWSAMRMAVTFTASDIALCAARNEANPEALARGYLRNLVAAGYVQELPERQKGSGFGSAGYRKRYRLLKNTGLNAPVWREKPNVIHDFNTGEDVPCGNNP